MDKNAIRKFSIWARRELISRVSQRAALYEITADNYGDQNAGSVHGRLMSAAEKTQRTALIAQIKDKGYEQVMEEIAYTWFNRFCALRFMEVNGYLPTHIRVFTNDDNAFKPQILDEAINMEMDGLDMQKVYDLKNANDDDALFKYMIITQCNALSSILPGIFQRISDYTELLFPDNLLRDGSVLEQMVTMIPQEDWTDQVQIIGWLYQYYNTEPKDQVFANLKKNIKISKENIPAATQLFTPDWIVRYMVENSLGRLWLEGHPNDELKAGWKYYLDEAEQEPAVQAQLAEIRKEYAALKPEEILAIDPCQGSGHILAYMFDVLVQIYEAYGYSAREAASSIVENNIWGLDIDERAAQLAYFSVMMKARQYDRRFFSRKDENDRPLVPQPHVYAIQESNNLDPHCIEYFVDGRKNLKSAIDTLVKELHDAKEYGSILNVTQVDFDALYSRFEEIQNETMPGIYSYQSMETLLPFVQLAQAMAQKYHAVVTNPPYMSYKGMNGKISSYVQRRFPDSKLDLFAVFIERCSEMTKQGCFQAMITQNAFMFLGSFKKLRRNILQKDIVNLVHLGPRAFEEIGGEVVQTTAFILRLSDISLYRAIYARLVDGENQNAKEIMFLSGSNRYSVSKKMFYTVPDYPFAYWTHENAIKAFRDRKELSEVAEIVSGMTTGNNGLYLRLWWEVRLHNMALGYSHIDQVNLNRQYWFPYNKGGSFRRWYGNNEYLVNWSQSGNFNRAKTTMTHLYLKKCLTWADISTNDFAARACEEGFFFDVQGSCAFPDNDTYWPLLALLNTKIMTYFTKVLNPTMHTQVGDIKRVPFMMPDNVDYISQIAKENVLLAKQDWDSFETSWDFLTHPFIAMLSTNEVANHKNNSVKDCYLRWEKECEERFNRVWKNEEILNKIFVETYGLQDVVRPNIEEKDITIHQADLLREVKSFISYSVGCMFGRYSLDGSGIAYAGGGWDASAYETYQPDKDAILPICDDEYFSDDIVGRFAKFVETVYGTVSLEDNLRFIADVLGGKGPSREVIRNYFINDFYADHLKIYQKRPIYWLFDSGKKNGFKCLIYMHRYQSDTIARIRTDYVHEQQSRYRTAIADLESRITNAGTGERVKLTKKLDSIKAQAEELRIYEEKIHHLADQMIRIDLDDGVKVNYAKFQDVLAKIK